MTEDSENNGATSAPDFHTDMPVGEILRRTRTHYGLNLQQVEQILRIRASNLEALETGDVSQLPGRVYAIGFVRAYAEYLGLDGDKMVHLFKQQSVGDKKKIDLSFPVPADETKVPNLYIIGSSLAGLIVLLGFIVFMIFPDKDEKSIPPVPESLTGSTITDAPALVEAPDVSQESVDDSSSEQGEAQNVQAPSTASQNRIVLEIKEASWIEIKNAQGAAILRQVLKPGDIYMVPPEQGLVMSTGNAGGIVVKLDGNALPALGESGEIKRNLALDPDKLNIKRKN